MATYTLIASTTVGSGGASSIDFTSIPATYTDLVLKVSARTNRTAIANDLLVVINGTSTAIHSNRNLAGDGASATSGSSSGDTSGYANTADGSSATASTFSNIELYFPNYAGSNNKSFASDGVYENNATTAGMKFIANLYASTSAITSLSVNGNGFNFVQYTTAYLYGIKNS